MPCHILKCVYLAVAAPKDRDTGDIDDAFFLPVQLALVAIVAEYRRDGVAGVDSIDASASHGKELAVYG